MGSNESPVKPYDQRLPCACTFCRLAIEDMLIVLGPAFVYDVFVHPRDIIAARSTARALMADVKDSPLAPYLNIHPHDGLERGEWFISANGKTLGTEGC
jgi:hypothetical protein